MEIPDRVSCGPLPTSETFLNESVPKPLITDAQQLRSPIFAERNTIAWTLHFL